MAGTTRADCCGGNHLARARWSLGYPDRAAAAIRDAVALTAKLAHPLSTVLTLSTGAFIEYERGDHDAARETAERMVALAKMHELTGWIDDGLVIVACVKARQQRDRRSLDELCEQLSVSRSGTAFRRVINLILLAELLSEIGDANRGVAILDAIPPEHRDTILAPEIRRVRGELLLHRGERSEGEQQFQEAIDVARHRSQRILELRATTSLGRLWQQQGRQSEACQMLGDVYGWFTEGFDTADLRAAKTLLDDLRDASGRGGDPTPGDEMTR